MNQLDYLRALEGALSSLPREEQLEILSDYREHFEMALADGKSEEEVAGTLGPPDRLARQYRVKTLVERAEKQPSSGNLLRAVVATLGLGFFNIVFLLGPFLVLCSLGLAYFVVATLLFLAGLFIIAGGLLSSVFTIFSGLAWGGLFLGLGLMALSLGLILVGVKGTGVFYQMVLRYLKMNSRIIKGVKSDENH